MELNDKEFDAAFRQKVFDADPQFEDAAWDKMERKLKRRDRIVFFRKSALLLLLVLLAGVWGYVSLNNSPDKEDRFAKDKNEHSASPVVSGPAPGKRNGLTAAGRGAGLTDAGKVPSEAVSARNGSIPELLIQRDALEPRDFVPHAEQQRNLYGETALVLGFPAADGLTDTLSVRLRPLKALDAILPSAVLPAGNAVKIKRNLPVSLAISAGPEFNSASSVVGGDPGFSAGLTLGFGISRRLDLQAGLRYSVKNYNSGPGVSYSFPGTSAWMQNNLTGLDAACHVLEIPIQASYQVMKRGFSSVHLNAGVSSYLMLKENYSLKYNSLYGESSWDLQKRNENRHLLSIVDLSATYYVKVQRTNLKVGLEPFVKIPLSGVGEGNINLKSSGIALKIRYDLDKKNN